MNRNTQQFLQRKIPKTTKVHEEKKEKTREMATRESIDLEISIILAYWVFSMSRLVPNLDLVTVYY